MFNKNLKNLNFILITGLIFLISSFFIVPAQAQAVDILDINFEQQPLFSNANILPGDEIIRYVEVRNKDSENSYTIATKADNVTNSDGLGDVMYLTIFNHDTNEIYYENILTDFFNAGVVELSDLGPGETIKYDYKIYFQNTAGNAYQNKTLGFDIVVGDGNSESVGGEIGGGTGGGGYSHHNLMISNEYVSSLGDTYATITWHTSDSATSNPLAATSRVIYDTVSHPDLTGQSGPNYSYAFSTAEDATMVVDHSVTITGLIPDTVYYFRSVSHASPDIVGGELSFRTNSSGQAPKQLPAGKKKITTSQTSDITGGGQAGGASGGATGGTIAGQAVVAEQFVPLNPDLSQPAQQPEIKGVSAAAATGCQTPGYAWWVWLLVLFLHLLIVVSYPFFINSSGSESAEQADLSKVVKLTRLWRLMVILILLSIYLLLVLFFRFPLLQLAVVLLTYLTILMFYNLAQPGINQAKNISWPVTSAVPAISPITVYLYCGTWAWWLCLLVIGLYLLGVYFYSRHIFKAVVFSYAYLALIFFTALIIVLELVFYSCLVCF